MVSLHFGTCNSFFLKFLSGFTRPVIARAAPRRNDLYGKGRAPGKSGPTLVVAVI